MSESEAMNFTTGNVPINRDTVIRVLVLLQAPDTLVSDVPGDDQIDTDDLEDLIRRVHRRRLTDAWLERLPFTGSRSTPILGPGSGVGTTGAVLLAFQVGAGVDVAFLSRALGISDHAAGTAMYDARLALTGSQITGCEAARHRLGRYSDPNLGRDDFAALINHSNACQNCSQVLDEFRAVDRNIQSTCDDAVVPDGGETGIQSIYNQHLLLVLLPAVLVVVLAVSALAAIGFSAVTQSEAAPLFAQEEPGEHSGWLILSSETEIMAVDLDHGERRRILERPSHDWWNPWTLSPDRTLAVRWEESSFGESRRGALRAYDMNGQRQYLHRWQGPRSRIFSGWLDNQTVLFVERGAVRRAGVISEVPLDAQPSIVAADLVTGRERHLFQGALDKAVPSPDGSHVALVRPAASSWPGRTIEIRPVDEDGLGSPTNIVEHRALNWTSRMVWSDDGQSLYVTLIDEREVAYPLPEEGEAAPSPYEFDKLLLARLGTDGSLTEFDDDPDQGWIVVQAISPDESAAAVLFNESQNRDGDWFHGAIDLESGELSVSEVDVSGSRWWNSEVLWLPDNHTRLIQQTSAHYFSEQVDDPLPESLVLFAMTTGNNPTPTLVFHDAATLNLRMGQGLALLGWVSDEVMRDDESETETTPRPAATSRVSSATSSHRLFGDSSVASTRRHVLIERVSPDVATRVRLVHLQAWAGTENELEGVRDYSWLPREPAVIGAVEPDENGSRLIMLSSDRSSPMNNRLLDPAGVGDQTHLIYRGPKVSPDGRRIAFYIDDERENQRALWVGAWEGAVGKVEQWDVPDDARVDPTPLIEWIGNGQLLHTSATDWSDGYPQRAQLLRTAIQDDGSFGTSEIHAFSISARDRGIELLDLEIGPEYSRVAFRVRHYTERDPEEGTSDSIQISPAQDLTQNLEIVRAGHGSGMTWLDGDDWLVASIDNRIALMNATGRVVEPLTDEPSAFPILVPNREIWYQELSDEGQIMRMTFSTD